MNPEEFEQLAGITLEPWQREFVDNILSGKHTQFVMTQPRRGRYHLVEQVLRLDGWTKSEDGRYWYK